MEKKVKISAWEKVENHIDSIVEWVADGMQIKDIAKQLGISRTTLWKLSKEKQQLKDALSYEIVATKNVETSLYNKCLGYDHKFFVDVKLKETWYDDNGKLHTREVLQKQEKCVYVEPDTNAIKFWLLNKDPEHYKSEQPEINITNELLEKSDEVLVKIRQLATDSTDDTKKEN